VRNDTKRGLGEGKSDDSLGSAREMSAANVRNA
jgi:hypothetical protein